MLNQDAAALYLTTSSVIWGTLLRVARRSAEPGEGVRCGRGGTADSLERCRTRWRASSLALLRPPPNKVALRGEGGGKQEETREGQPRSTLAAFTTCNRAGGPR